MIAAAACTRLGRTSLELVDDAEPVKTGKVFRVISVTTSNAESTVYARGADEDEYGAKYGAKTTVEAQWTMSSSPLFAPGDLITISGG